MPLPLLPASRCICVLQIMAYIEVGLFCTVFIAAMFRVCKCCFG